MEIAGALRADIDSAVFGHALQLHADAEPARSRDPAGSRVAGARVHTAGSGRLFAPAQVLPVRRLCADVYRTGRRRAHHTAVSVHVCRGINQSSSSPSLFESDHRIRRK